MAIYDLWGIKAEASQHSSALHRLKHLSCCWILGKRNLEKGSWAVSFPPCIGQHGSGQHINSVAENTPVLQHESPTSTWFWMLAKHKYLSGNNRLHSSRTQSKRKAGRRYCSLWQVRVSDSLRRQSWQDPQNQFFLFMSKQQMAEFAQKIEKKQPFH